MPPRRAIPRRLGAPLLAFAALVGSTFAVAPARPAAAVPTYGVDERAQAITLSEREREVLLWMSRGKSGSDIAAILAISPETVRTYIRRIYDKLDVADRVAATVKGLKLGLIEA